MEKGRRVAVARGARESAETVASLRKFGVDAFALPLIRIVRKKLSARSVAALKHLDNFDYIFFSSPRAARFFALELRERRILRAKKPKIVAVGPATALALRASRMRADIMPERASGLDAVRKLKDLRGARILLPRSAIAPLDVVHELRRKGARVVVVPLYTTETVPLSEKLLSPFRENRVDAIIFASPSGIRGFIENIGKTSALKRSLSVICIGAHTAKAARAAGFKKVRISEDLTPRGLLDTIKRLP